MSPDGSCRPAGVVLHPLTSMALGPFLPGTVISRPEIGCLTRYSPTALQTPPANSRGTRVQARRLTGLPAVWSMVFGGNDERVHASQCADATESKDAPPPSGPCLPT